MIYNVWIRALPYSLESICLESWELNRDLNMVPHVRHGVWNHGPLEWCQNERDGIWNHRRLECLLRRLFRRRSKKTFTLRVTGLCEGKSAIWWRHHATRASNSLFSWLFRLSQNSAFMVLWEGNTLVSSEFSLQRASKIKSVSMSWSHHGMEKLGISHDTCSHFLSVGIVLCHCN